ncbi:MFS transporter [Phytohabitans kaempferiae]|uniref:MFS transporter n=1 Tax=Phytohabitans kaempferiae TaxID=1620943 RepID=A0ABV6LXR5_9ACTN
MPSQSQHPRAMTAILTGATFLAGLDLFIVNVAFDEIGRDFAGAGSAPALAELSWVLNAYTVVFAALLVPLGQLSDRYGRKLGFVAGLAVFTGASLACGFADNVWSLVAFRVVQGAGAAAMTPASLGLLLAALPPQRRAAGARLWALTSALAAALGPAVGGGLVELSWRWAFWINVPVGLLLVLVAVRYVPEVRHNLTASRPDLLGAGLLVLAVGVLVLGLVQANDWGWSSAQVVGCFVAAAAAIAAFAARSARHRSPVIEPTLLRVRSFTWANVATLAFSAGFGAALLLSILWLQQAWGYSALHAGLAIAVGPLCVPITSILAARLLPRVSPSRLIALGSLAVTAAAAVQASTLNATPAYLTSFLAPWLLVGVGVGLAMPNQVAAATATLPPAHASAGSGVVSTSRQIGFALGVAILAGILGTGAANIGTARAAWLFVAATGILAAAAALTMETSGRSARGGTDPGPPSPEQPASPSQPTSRESS